LINDSGLVVGVGVGINRGGVAGTTTWLIYNAIPISTTSSPIRHILGRRLGRFLIVHLFPLRYMLA
jgi:hypothetical protein